MMDFRLRASLEARRAGSFSLDFFVTDPPRERPIGGGGTHHTGEIGNIESNLNSTLFKMKFKKI